jgi:hypothetical protein
MLLDDKRLLCLAVRATKTVDTKQYLWITDSSFFEARNPGQYAARNLGVSQHV